MLAVENLHISVHHQPILRGIHLTVKAGEIHALMGPNGSGKTSLAQFLAGHPSYTVTEGKVTYKQSDLLALSAEERAKEGVFLAFQYPVEIPGVNNAYFLKAALNAQRKHHGLEALDAVDFLALVKNKMKTLGMDARFLERSVNADFSGGEKKRNEILQMAVLEPQLAILDETDSGLDIDALRQVAEGINLLRSPKRSMLVITHYQRLLEYIVPDCVHILAHGRVIASGDRSLALKLEKQGYAHLLDPHAAFPEAL